MERESLTLRQSNRRLTQKTNGFAKELGWFERQLWLSLAYYHLMLPHGSLRQPLAKSEPTRGSGSPRKWQQVTPAKGAVLTNHIWSIFELLSFRPSVQFIDNMESVEPLFKLIELTFKYLSIQV